MLPRSRFAVLIALAGAQLLLAPLSIASPVAEDIDPFWVGPTSYLQYAARTSDTSVQQTTQFQVGYGWSSGIALDVNVPVIFEDLSAASTNETPRIAGGFSSRVQLDAFYRLWGDAYQYLGFDLGVVLPFQTDPKSQDTRLSTWGIPIELLGRIDWDWIALRPSFYDYPSFPNLTTNANGGHSYEDGGNYIELALVVSFLSHTAYSPFLGWTEVPPRKNDSGTDAGTPVHTFLTTESIIQRSRIFTGGIDLAPFRSAVVLSAQLDFITNSADANSSLQWVGRARWNF